MERLRQPVGIRTNKGIKIAVVLDEELFMKIRDRAREEGKFFSEVLNDFALCGMLDIEESENDEPGNDNDRPYTMLS